MNRIKIFFSTVVFLTVLPALVLGQDNLLKIQGTVPSNTDVEQIQKIVLRMVMGVKYQRPYLVYKHFHPDPDDASPASWEELDQFKTTLAGIFQTLDRRSSADKSLPGMSNTFDFENSRKTLKFKRNGTEAELQTSFGFYKLPGDPAVLEKLPAEEVNALSDIQRADRAKFRSVKLEFHKMDGSWYLSSLKDLDSVFNNMVDYYGKIDLSPAKIKD
ncbi:MAG: hypothetical protein FVQ81_03285 [Candidatus Glassbacteria bacterium]|nr:hypothetical protein [Candidatus Glassbacteria bacterium]